LPELPDEKKARFVAAYGLSSYDADVLIADRESAEFFETLAKGRDAKMAANWMMGDFFAALNRLGKDITTSPVSAGHLGELIDLISGEVISGRIAKEVFEIMLETGEAPGKIVESRGLKQVTDTGAIEKAVDEVIAASPKQVEQVKLKPSMLGWFVGQVMKATGGKANPAAGMLPREAEWGAGGLAASLARNALACYRHELQFIAKTSAVRRTQVSGARMLDC
jgi:aspartyl-tRNA(Asn)/glutamyl-tRNA(Gln) amidotransferase subunit B